MPKFSEIRCLFRRWPSTFGNNAIAGDVTPTGNRHRKFVIPLTASIRSRNNPN
jgi:hypothetical protein